MQYATFEIMGRRLLLDAAESLALSQGKPIEESACAEGEAGFRLCHGVYLPQPGIGEAEAIGDFLDARDHWIGCLAGGTCHLLAFHDALAFDAVYQGYSLAIPFAALIRAGEAVAGLIDGQRSKAASCFLRYANLTPAENLLNRPGIIAVKGPSRLLGPDAPGHWRPLAEPALAARAAKIIH